MNGGQVVIGQLAPKRILEIDASQGNGSLVKVIIVCYELRLCANAWPMDASPVIFENDLTAFVVVRHDQIGLRVLDSSVVRAEEEAVDFSSGLGGKLRAVSGEILSEPGRHQRQGWRDQRAQRAGDGSFFYDETIGHSRLVSHVDYSGDTRPHWAAAGRRKIAESYAADGVVAVITEAEHVAVAGEM